MKEDIKKIKNILLFFQYVLCLYIGFKIGSLIYLIFS